MLAGSRRLCPRGPRAALPALFAGTEEPRRPAPSVPARRHPRPGPSAPCGRSQPPLGPGHQTAAAAAPREECGTPLSAPTAPTAPSGTRTPGRCRRERCAARTGPRPRPRPRPQPRRPQLPRGRSRVPFPPHPAKIRLKWPPEAAGPRRAGPALLSLARLRRAAPAARTALPARPRRAALTMAPGPGAAAACGAGLLHAESAALRWGRGGRGLGRAGDEPQRPGRAGHMGRAATTCRRRAALGRPPRGRARRRRGPLARPAEVASTPACGCLAWAPQPRAGFSVGPGSGRLAARGRGGPSAGLAAPASGRGTMAARLP